ncbi:MAG: hypothetical protein R3290_08870 [Acidimicrobiia bacterium]|nr:hypothetical protein [Acidimicrobiia bacterium]
MVRSTDHGKTISVRSPRTVGGRSGLIQWIRWSCQAKLPSVSTSAHSGSAAASAWSGTPLVPYRSRLIQRAGDRSLRHTDPSVSKRRYGSPK